MKFKLEIDLNGSPFMRESPEEGLYLILRAAAREARGGVTPDRRIALQSPGGSTVGYMVLESDLQWPEPMRMEEL